MTIASARHTPALTTRIAARLPRVPRVQVPMTWLRSLSNALSFALDPDQQAPRPMIRPGTTDELINLR